MHDFRVSWLGREWNALYLATKLHSLEFLDIFVETLTETEFRLFLSKFLFSSRYAKYQANFRFVKDLECGIPAPDIVVRFYLKHLVITLLKKKMILDVEH